MHRTWATAPSKTKEEDEGGRRQRQAAKDSGAVGLPGELTDGDLTEVGMAAS